MLPVPAPPLPRLQDEAGRICEDSDGGQRPAGRSRPTIPRLHDPTVLATARKRAEAEIAHSRLADGNSFYAGARRRHIESISSIRDGGRIKIVLITVRCSAGNYAVDLAIHLQCLDLPAARHRSIHVTRDIHIGDLVSQQIGGRADRFRRSTDPPGLIIQIADDVAIDTAADDRFTLFPSASPVSSLSCTSLSRFLSTKNATMFPVIPALPKTSPLING